CPSTSGIPPSSPFHRTSTSCGRPRRTDVRAWLDHLPELRVGLQPGWYELASHVQRGEAQRLIELLARAVPGVETVVECAWEELDAVVLGPSTLVFVAVPEAVTHEVIVARLKAHAVRLGVYQQAGV